MIHWKAECFFPDYNFLQKFLSSIPVKITPENTYIIPEDT